MDKSYEDILKPIIHSFHPQKGKLAHVIHSDRELLSSISSITITLETANYRYVDPFYGEILANNPMEEFINIDCDTVSLKLSTWRDIELLSIKHNNGIRGFFSNSLEVVPISLEFGSFDEQNRIDLTVKYFLTNTDSYPAMKGSSEEHSKFEGEFRVKLELEPMLFLDKRKTRTIPLGKMIDTKYYDTNTLEPVNLWVCEEWYKYYRINLTKS